MKWTCCGRDMRICLWERFKLTSSRPGLCGGCRNCLSGPAVLSLQRDKWFCGSVPRMRRTYCALENGTGQRLFQFHSLTRSEADTSELQSRRHLEFPLRIAKK